MVEMVDVRLRKLQIDERYERSDKIMATLAGSEGPTRITMCSGNDLPGNNLGGFQLFYGKYNPQAGPAHGNIKGDCTEHSLYDKVIQINFWIWAPEEYAGMEIVMTDYNDASATPKTITAGVTGDLTAARRQTIDFTSNDFFGFETLMDKTDRITNIDVLSYDADAFYKWKSEAEAQARTGLQPNDWYDVEEQSARDADNWYDRYNGEILAINKAQAMANQEVAVPIDTYVLRPEEYEQLLNQMCAFVFSLDGTAEECSGYISNAASAVTVVEGAESGEAAVAEEAAATVPDEAKLVNGIDDHLDEDNDENTVALVFACIGFFLLSSMVGFILWRYVCGMPNMMKKNKNNGTILVNQSGRSDRTAGQSKLDDIM